MQTFETSDMHSKNALTYFNVSFCVHENTVKMAVRKNGPGKLEGPGALAF